MKFWQKAFIGMLVVFIVSINICLYLISKHSYSLNMKRNTDRALGEYHFILNSVRETLDSVYYRDQSAPTPAFMQSFMRSYADYYSKQNVYLELWHTNKPVFSNAPSVAGTRKEINNLTNNKYITLSRSVNGKNYLYIAGKLNGQYGNYMLVYVRDLSELYGSQAQLNRYLIMVSASVEIAMALVLLLLLRKLTNPIREMQKVTREIAGGIYSQRISVHGRDEFHDLSENFNQMASSIQEKINELDKTAQEKQRLVDNLAHELRTPLTAIRGYAEYLQNAKANEQARQTAASYILSETVRMQVLAFKLLDLALVRNTSLEPQRIILSELMNQVKSATKQNVKKKNIELIISCTMNELIGDPVLLQSLLVNLVDNAVRASFNGSTIMVSAYFADLPILEVQDFGCGMDEDQTTMVCEPFYRVDKARARSSGGVGLGLSLCRQIAHLHGAELKIKSRPGEGATVQVIFTTLLQPSENSLMPDVV